MSREYTFACLRDMGGMRAAGEAAPHENTYIPP